MTSDDKPVDSARMSAEEWVDAPSDTISLRHTGGEPIDTKDLKINVQINGTNYEYSPSNISENLGGKGVWEMADVIQINTSKEWGVGIANEKDVDVKVIDTASKEVLPKYRIDLSPKSPASIDFDIDGDTVVPKGTFISSFKVLGAAFQGTDDYGTIYDRMVTSRLKVGNETFDPWDDYNLPVTGNLNGRVTNSWSLPATYPAGTPVTVIGRGWDHKSSGLNYNLDSSWYKTMEVSSTSDSPNLKVLRNGDSVPKIPGAMEQPPIEDFLKDYVKNDKILLNENEAIFLFELGINVDEDPESTGIDYQDLVVLMTIDPAPAS